MDSLLHGIWFFIPFSCIHFPSHHFAPSPDNDFIELSRLKKKIRLWTHTQGRGDGKGMLWGPDPPEPGDEISSKINNSPKIKNSPKPALGVGSGWFLRSLPTHSGILNHQFLLFSDPRIPRTPFTPTGLRWGQLQPHLGIFSNRFMTGKVGESKNVLGKFFSMNNSSSSDSNA